MLSRPVDSRPSRWRRAYNSVLRFGTDRSGNVAMVICIGLVPLLIGVGAAIDSARMHNARAKAQADLDFALIAAVNEIGTEDKAKIKTKLSHWFHAQQATNEATFVLEDVVVNLDTDVVTATASARLPTSLMGLAGIEQMPISVTSSAQGADKPHMQIFLALDKSASMLLAATPEGQKKMQKDVGCTFACHIADMDIEKKGYKTHYEYSQKKNILLRVDVATQALSNSLTVIEAADPLHERIKVGLYKVGSEAKEVLAPTLNFTTVRNRLAESTYGMTSSTSDETTYFNVSLPQLTKMVGSAGDGHLSGVPQKLVLLVTDGLQSNRHWVHNDNEIHLVAPLNPKWCADMKKAGAVVAVLYTEYLPLTGDWGYDRTVGRTMTSAKWKEAWGGERRTNIPGSITRQNYIPYALKDCASSEDLFMSASSQAEIEKSIKDLLRAFLSAPRLTQ